MAIENYTVGRPVFLSERFDVFPGAPPPKPGPCTPRLGDIEVLCQSRANLAAKLSTPGTESAIGSSSLLNDAPGVIWGPWGPTQPQNPCAHFEILCRTRAFFEEMQNVPNRDALTFFSLDTSPIDSSPSASAISSLGVFGVILYYAIQLIPGVRAALAGASMFSKDSMSSTTVPEMT